VELVVELWDQDSLIDDYIGTGSIVLPSAAGLYDGHSVNVKFHSKKQEDEGNADISFCATLIPSKHEKDVTTNPLYDGSRSDALSPLYGGDI
jgi:hypothetical protein